MGWSERFIAEIERESVRPAWVVESIGSGESDGFSFGREWKAASIAGLGLRASVTGVQFSGARLDPQSWQATMGGFVVTLSEWESVGDVLRRGYLIRVRMGFPGWSEEDYEPVAFGRLRSMEIARGACTLTVDGPESLFVTRQSNDSGSTQYFDGLSSSTIAAGNSYAISDSTLEVTSASGFEKDSDGSGLLLITPGGGDPFYDSWSSLATNTFSINGSGLFGTADAPASNPDTVQEVAYLAGHPMDIIRKMMVSTGSGTNGTYDTLPLRWALGLPESFVAVDDISVWKGRYTTGTGNAMDVDLRVEAAVTDGLAWLRSWASVIGVFPAMRQGQMTVRSALEGKREALDTYVAMKITEDMIGGVGSIKPWDSSMRTAVYRLYEFNDTSDSSPTSFARYQRSGGPHIPMLGSNYVNVSSFIDFAGKTGPALADILTVFATNVGSWANQMPGSVSLLVRRWVAAQLCVGDIVSLTMTRGGVSFDEVPGMVTQVSAFNGAGATMTIAFPENLVTSSITT